MDSQNTQKKYVCYFRVSTNKQNLGLDAQKTVTDRFCKDGVIINEFTEKESGKNDNRKELDKAIQLCKSVGAVLVIAKLDRLSRNLTFVSTLMDSKLDFVCCDMPNANKLTISIFAAIAQNERETISKRTKDALAELKKKGKKLGTPKNLTDKARQKSIKVRSEKAKESNNNKQIMNLVSIYSEQKYSLRKIAQILNELGMKTQKGKEFTVSQIQMYKKRIDSQVGAN